MRRTITNRVLHTTKSIKLVMLAAIGICLFFIYKETYWKRVDPYWKMYKPVKVKPYVDVDFRKGCYWRYVWWSNRNTYTLDNKKAFESVLLNRLPGNDTLCGRDQSYPDINNNLIKGIWHVTDTGQEIYIKSAYYDNRMFDATKVRLIGVSPLVNARFYCQFYYEDGRVISRFGYAVSDNIECFKGKYRPHMYICDVSRFKERPLLVSLVSGVCQYTRNWIKVKNYMSPFTQPKTETIGLCVNMLHNMHSQESLDRFIEFVELNKLLGINDIYFYGYHNVSTKVEKAIKLYISTNQIQVTPWSLPKQGMKVHNYLQSAAINDCLYDNMNRHKYMTVFDIDEFIIPKENKSVLHVLNQLKSRYTNAAVFYFRNVMFNTNSYPADDPDLKNKKYRHNYALSHTLHQNPFIQYQDGKSVYFTKAVVYAWIHYHVSILPVYRILFGSASPIDVKLASLHHYRPCLGKGIKDPGWQKCIHPANIRDKSVHRFENELLYRTNQIRLKL